MGIGYDEFPTQGKFLGLRCEVCFDYDTTKTVSGEIVRDDREAPGRMIIKLDDGRFLLSTECQYRLL